MVVAKSQSPDGDFFIGDPQLHYIGEFCGKIDTQTVWFSLVVTSSTPYFIAAFCIFLHPQNCTTLANSTFVSPSTSIILGFSSTVNCQFLHSSWPPFLLMKTFQAALAERPYAQLRGVAIRLGVHVRRQNAKPYWIQRILAFWSDAALAEAWLARLSVSTLNALRLLIEVDSIPRSLFLGEYGSIRYVSGHSRWQPPPWQAPQTVSEELYYAGLLYPLDGPTIERSQRVGLPAELRTQLRAQLQPLLVDDAGADSAPLVDSSEPTILPLVHDVAQLLMGLHHAAVQSDERTVTANGRWLRRPQLVALNRRVLQPDVDVQRSHKAAPRLCRLMFLATAAGLQQQGHIQPQGWAWLAASPSQQIERLWQAWRMADVQLRTIYAEPDGAMAPPWPEPLVAHLAQQAKPTTAGELALALVSDPTVETRYWTANVADLTELTQLIEALCCGSLGALGIVVPCPPGESAASEQQRKPTRYRVTRLGRRLLAETAADTDEPCDDAPWRIEQQSQEAWLVCGPAGGRYHAQAQLAGYAAGWTLTQREREPHSCFELQAQRVARATAVGYGEADLQSALQALGIIVTAEQVAQLMSWHRQGRRLHYALLPLLRTETATEMRQLREQTALREVLGELLTPTLSVVTAPVDALAAQIRRAGFLLTQPPVHTANAVQTTLDGGQKAITSAAGALWLAGQCYALLGQHLPLPLPPPMEALQTLFATLTPMEQAVLIAQRTQLVTQLLDLLDGRPLMPPPQPSDPAQWRPLIAEAIATQANLQIDYMSAGRNLLIRLTVEPYWISERNGVAYLEGYGHEAGHTLTLRLDRIQALVLLGSGGGRSV
jgi:hypothetical protein